MAPKVKVFLVFLAVMAILSVLSFFDVFRGVRSANLLDSSDPLPLGLDEDADQDGLSNQDENYWNTDFQNPDSDGDGFLDGEEVASGFDPRESSSHELGDRLEDTVYGSVRIVEAGDFMNVNLTEDAGRLLAAGIAAGDLSRKSDDTTFQSGVDAVAVSAIDNFYKSMPAVNATLNIVADSKENQEKYLEQLGSIFQNDLFSFTGKLNTDVNPFTQTTYFKDRAEHFKKSRENAALLSVPKNWTETHVKILDLLNSFYLNHLSISEYDNDSVKAIIAFNDIENLNTVTRNLLQEVQEKISANELKPENSVFKIMNTLLGI